MWVRRRVHSTTPLYDEQALRLHDEQLRAMNWAKRTNASMILHGRKRPNTVPDLAPGVIMCCGGARRCVTSENQNASIALGCSDYSRSISMIQPNTAFWPRCCSSCASPFSCSNSRQEEHHFVNLILPALRREPRRRFIEIGAADGLYMSNTLFLEHCLRWSGVLLDADPNNFRKLLRNRPSATSIFTSICETRTTRKFAKCYGACSGASRIADQKGLPNLLDQSNWKKYSQSGVGIIDVPCVPLQDYLDRLSIDHVDWFSVDVEGAELQLLRSINWARFSATAMTVEERQRAGSVEMRKNLEVRQFLTKTVGMIKVLTACWKVRKICDSYFVNPRSVNVTKVRGLVQSYTTSPEVQLSDERRSDFDGDQMHCGKN